MGERFTPTFEILNRYRYTGSDLRDLPGRLFEHVQGQSVFTQQRGTWNYSSRQQLDLRVEFTPRVRDGVLLTAEAFNVLGGNTVTSIKTTLDDSYFTDRSAFFGATRLRMAPRTLRLGVRVEKP